MNTANKIDLNTGKVFPWSFIFFGFLITAAGFFLILSGKTLIGILLIPVGFISYFTNYGLEIDADKSYFNEYVRILGFRKNNKITYSAVERLYIVKSKISQRANSYGGSVSTFRDEIYEAYLRFQGNDERVFLLENKNKEQVMSRLSSIATTLNMPVEDRT